MTVAVSRTAARWRPSAGRVLLVGAVLLVVVAALPWDAVGTDLSQRFAGPSAQHLFGTDQLGRDVLARLAVGARLSIGFTVVALALCTAIGTVLGLLAGWAGRVVGQAFQRLIDVLVSIPAIVVGLVVVAASEDPPDLGTLLLAVVLVGWTPFARLTFQLAARERGREYVEGAVALGAGTGRIVFRHVLPNLLRPLGAHACLRFANVLLSIAGLSFLGLGAQPPTPEWGAMLAEGRQYMFVAPQLVLLPALAVVGSALAVTLAGRALERRWDAANG
ncbi:ABC transporter permease [Pseudonocardia endophytica]|uniref:Peptide/nickel transport system permease protein n=1 Tax=Pseudonocardia endophytica TaxID=401976 RepID=A0A4R1I5A2_PSEEN|nr:ABC transporter permease [Pseudonocardia endophytica]TCK27789.1 peptide/nickel transport system permease protein [Pseudonocardia endophytica]